MFVSAGSSLQTLRFAQTHENSWALSYYQSWPFCYSNMRWVNKGNTPILLLNVVRFIGLGLDCISLCPFNLLLADAVDLTYNLMMPWPQRVLTCASANIHCHVTSFACACHSYQICELCLFIVLPVTLEVYSVLYFGVQFISWRKCDVSGWAAASSTCSWPTKMSGLSMWL